MKKENESIIDTSWNGVIKWGGLSLFFAGVILVIFVLFVIIFKQTLPLPAKEVLENPTIPTRLFMLTAFGELLLMPGGFALYFALKNIRKTTMFLATTIWMVSPLMFLVSRGLIISLSQVSTKYLESGNELIKAAFLASAEHVLEIQNIYAIMALTCLSIASIMIGVVMLKSVFGRFIAYVLILAGIFTLITPFAVIMKVPLIISFIGLFLSAVWQLKIGIKLFNLGRIV